MSELKQSMVKYLVKHTRQQILTKVAALIEQRFSQRIHDMEVFARVFYASILSSYTRANQLGGKVGLIIPELEPITRALYSMSSTKANRQGSFDLSKAFEVANSLRITYRAPMSIKDNTLTYKLTFTINHPLLIALEEGSVSWENLEKVKIKGILQSALTRLKEDKGKAYVSSNVAQVLRSAILKLSKGGFQIVRNKRPYMEIAVKNIIRQKDFIQILTKS